MTLQNNKLKKEKGGGEKKKYIIKWSRNNKRSNKLKTRSILCLWELAVCHTWTPEPGLRLQRAPMAGSLMYKLRWILQPPRLAPSTRWGVNAEFAIWSFQQPFWSRVSSNIMPELTPTFIKQSRFFPDLKHEQSGGFLHPWAYSIGWWAVSGRALKVCGTNGPAFKFAFRTGTKRHAVPCYFLQVRSKSIRVWGRTMTYNEHQTRCYSLGKFEK